MSYSANQYNYATPLSSVVSLVAEQPIQSDKKLFALFDNVLDGSCFPIDGDVGLWGSVLSDENGTLPTPLTVLVTENLSINAFRLVGAQDNYPTSFTVRLYNGSTVLYTITETDNSEVEYIHYLPRTITVTKYEVIVYAISAAGAVARLINVYNPGYLKRSDISTVSLLNVSDTSILHDLSRSDALHVSDTVSSSMHSTVVVSEELRAALAAISEYTVQAFNTDAVHVDTNNATEQHNTIERRTDALKVRLADVSSLHKTLGLSSDVLTLGIGSSRSELLCYIDSSKDTCSLHAVMAQAGVGLANVHSAMKQPSRRIYGKVYITYTDPMLSAQTVLESSGDAHNSNIQQILDGNYDADATLFTLYDNDLSGAYVVGDASSQVGWVSNTLSNELGEFDGEAPYIRLEFSERPINSLRVVFDTSHGSVAKDFTVDYVQRDGNVVSHSVVDNTEAQVELNYNISSVVAIVITITKVSKPYHPAAILEVPTFSTYLYVGYKDQSDLVSIDLLEELTYDDSIEALGGISANEISVVLDNSDGEFFFNNTASPVASFLRRNRRIEPWLGVEITEGDIEWYALGTFWSYRWDVPVEGLVAKVIGFDTIGLLDMTDFKTHHVQVNKSIGHLVDYVLTDAKAQFNFLEWNIDPALYDIIIPYAWFDVSSHTAALRKISTCYPMHIYCDRSGTICAAPQKLHMDFYYDTWSDSTNVIRKDYNSLHTTLPNIISVEVKNPVVARDTVLVEDTLSFNVANINTRTLNFNEPYISDISVDITCDPTVSYTYEVFSWGIEFNFTGTGTVSSIRCIGTSINLNNTSVIVGRNDESIRINGAIKRDISADFIQDSSLASELIRRIFSLSELDKFDVDVEYTGDISLTINDPILLLNGVAPDNRYNIRRHELFWNGSLRGSANLNT